MYYISNADFRNYKVFETSSIIEARAIAVKMIEKYPKATSWNIYTNKNAGRGGGHPHSAVVFYGTPAGYGWLHDSPAPRMILKNGKLRKNY